MEYPRAVAVVVAAAAGSFHLPLQRQGSLLQDMAIINLGFSDTLLFAIHIYTHTHIGERIRILYVYYKGDAEKKNIVSFYCSPFWPFI